MPTIEQATQPIDTTNLEVMDTLNKTSQVVGNISQPIQSISSFLFSPLPVIKAYPDNLRQFYKDSIPQYRLLPASTLF